MNILSDYHHSGLFNSLQLLFERRLGYNLYRQIGLTWYEKGYWNVYPHIDTAKQYLQLESKPKDGTPPLNDLAPLTPTSKTVPYILDDKHHNWFNEAITFEQFEKMDIDIVIASIPQHIKPFKELARIKNAKFIFQMGNVFNEVNLNEIPNLMANTLPANIPPTCNYIQYHQEIALDIFKPSSLAPKRKITSFINIYDHNKGYEDYMALKSTMPDYDFKSYGGQNVDGVITGIDNIAAIMQQSQFGFHSKYMGDGFGHIIYSWMACGKPIITRISDYKGKLGEELLEDGVTCFDLDRCNINELCDKISTIPPEKYQWMCQQARERFDTCVKYDEEEVKIREFLEKLN